MRKLFGGLLVMIVVALALLLIATPVCGYSADRLHVIIFAQDPKTEVEITVDDEKETVLLDAGVNYLSYDAEDPAASILAYGDAIKPRVTKGRDGEYYSMVMIQVPGESVGE